MRHLDLTLDLPAENLALDEALLLEAEQAATPTEVLRIWESPQTIVVVGRSSRTKLEVDCELCHRRGVPVFRRSSGGAAVVAGPGCLMYALVLSYELRPELRMLPRAHQFVLNELAAALARANFPVQCQGVSDLVLGDRKISGNSVRCLRNHLLYHGTILYDFALPLIGEYLLTPPRQPDYRQGRDHDRFVANLNSDAHTLRRVLIDQWNAHTPLPDWPRQATQRLATERYSRSEWTFRH